MSTCCTYYDGVLTPPSVLCKHAEVSSEYCAPGSLLSLEAALSHKLDLPEFLRLYLLYMKLQRAFQNTA